MLCDGCTPGGGPDAFGACRGWCGEEGKGFRFALGWQLEAPGPAVLFGRLWLRVPVADASTIWMPWVKGCAEE